MARSNCSSTPRCTCSMARILIGASATGTTVKHTSPGRILSHKAKFPSPREQQAIACILKSNLGNWRHNNPVDLLLQLLPTHVGEEPKRTSTHGKHFKVIRWSNGGVLRSTVSRAPRRRLPRSAAPGEGFTGRLLLVATD